MGATKALPNIEQPVRNYPTLNMKDLNDSINAYPNANVATDKYLIENAYFNNANHSQVASLTGEYLDKTEFTHNNMVPFFGGKIRGQIYGNNRAESILDNMIGTGSQVIQKMELAPLFRPEENVQWSYGAPNSNDFYQSRVNDVLKQSNVKPFESEHVGPGLDQGYSKEGSGGFNSGMEAREKYMDRNVDELRVATNPKIEYCLDGHEGPSYSHIQRPGILGKVEKYLPDRYFVQTQDRWLTTTGQEKGQTLQPIQQVGNPHRSQCTMEYGGIASARAEHLRPIAQTNFLPTKRQVLDTQDIGICSAQSRGDESKNNMSLKSFTNYANNRSTTAPQRMFGSSFNRELGAVIAPMMDILNPVRRNEYTENTGLRAFGDPGTTVPDTYVYNPKDVAPTTIRQTTMYAPNFNINNQKDSGQGGYQVKDIKINPNQRDSTSISYYGDAGGASTGWGATSQEAGRAFCTSDFKELTLPNTIQHGNMNLFHGQVPNCCIVKNDCDRENNRMWVPSGIPGQGFTKEMMGDSRPAMQQVYTQVTEERNTNDILNAFKSNPYTQSLSSYALM